MTTYTLRVTFDDTTTQVIDFSPILEGELYGSLRDVALFNQVQLDPEVHTLVWPNGADLTLRRCTIGQSTLKVSRHWHTNGH